MVRAGATDAGRERLHGPAISARSTAQGLALTDRGPQAPRKEREDQPQAVRISLREGWKPDGRDPATPGRGSRELGPGLAGRARIPLSPLRHWKSAKMV